MQITRFPTFHQQCRVADKTWNHCWKQHVWSFGFSVGTDEESACQQLESVSFRGCCHKRCFSLSFSKTFCRTINYFFQEKIMFYNNKKNNKKLWSLGGKSSTCLITLLKLCALMLGCVNPFTGVNTWTCLSDTKALWKYKKTHKKTHKTHGAQLFYMK